jgi:hypothetical protein
MVPRGQSNRSPALSTSRSSFFSWPFLSVFSCRPPLGPSLVRVFLGVPSFKANVVEPRRSPVIRANSHGGPLVPRNGRSAAVTEFRDSKPAPEFDEVSWWEVGSLGSVVERRSRRRIGSMPKAASHNRIPLWNAVLTYKCHWISPDAASTAETTGGWNRRRQSAVTKGIPGSCNPGARGDARRCDVARVLPHRYGSAGPGPRVTSYRLHLPKCCRPDRHSGVGAHIGILRRGTKY